MKDDSEAPFTEIKNKYPKPDDKPYKFEPTSGIRFIKYNDESILIYNF